MMMQLSVLIFLISILFAGTSLRHYAFEACGDCNCDSEKCCEEQEEE